MDNLAQLNMDNTYVQVEEDMVTIDVTEVETINKLNIPELAEYKGLTSFTEYNSYFTEIREGSYRIRCVNGIYLDCWSYMFLQCDYCFHPVDLHYGDIYRNWYMYCSNCHTNMCRLCFGETSSEIATDNGALHYAEREEQLSQCRLHNLSKHTIQGMEFNCDICEEHIITSKMLSSREHDYDICEKCSNTVVGINKINELNLTVTHRFVVYNNSKFGSMLDWVPILTDRDESFVLFNYNGKSEYADRLAIATEDDHGRMGYYMIKHNISLKELCEKLEIDDSEDTDTWHRFYNMPIKKFMISQNMSIQYG
jgi:hypothetical protein